MSENSKPTNPKDALGIRKAPLHLIPTGPLYEVGLAMLEGGRKYGAHNYRAVGTRASVYFDAAKRHLDAWWEGEDIDPDSGIHHLMKAAACLFVQRDSQIMGNDVDDRPLKYPDGLNMDKLNKQAAEMVERYQKCAAPFLEKDKQIGSSPGYGETIRAYKSKPVFEIKHLDRSGCGWTARNKDVKFLWKDLTLHPGTGYSKFCDEHHHPPKCGEAPGYYPTKEIAEAYLKAYEEKHNVV